jgi:hypothetical protein
MSNRSASRIGWHALAATIALVGACHRTRETPQPQRIVDDRTLYTCCNLHYQASDINDANYWVGHTLPAGTPVRIQKLAKDSVTFTTGDQQLTLTQEHGAKLEPFSQYLDKVLTASDPRPRIGAYPPAVRRAIDKARVERGMTRDQVILSLGYPPAHRTPSLNEREWTYWYNRWVTYKVVFGDSGKVVDVVGRPAPTAEMAIANADAPPQPADKAGKHKRKKKSSVP